MTAGDDCQFEIWNKIKSYGRTVEEWLKQDRLHDELDESTVSQNKGLYTWGKIPRFLFTGCDCELM